MKVRVGVGLGTTAPTDHGAFGALVDAVEGLGFDSLWLSERVSGPAPDPLVGLAVAAGRTERIKLGTSVQVLPGRNPALLAQAWASLDVLSGGRALPAFGLGVVDPVEQQAFGVERAARAGWFEEALPLLRRLWTETEVDHAGPRFRYEGLTVTPHPTSQPLDVWLGGRATTELRRTGRLGDGWLASFQTPAQVAAGRDVVDAAARDAGRAIDPEHFGAMILTADDLPDALAAAITRRNPDVDPTDLVALGPDAVADHVRAFVEVGFSKLVVVPLGGPGAGGAATTLARIADTVVDLQT